MHALGGLWSSWVVEMAPLKPSRGNRAKSALVIAGELVGGFVVFVLAMFGVGLLAMSKPLRTVDLVVGTLVLVVALGLMFATAERWAGFIPGFIVLPGLLRGIAFTISPPRDLDRVEAALLVVYCVIVMAMLWRFIPPRRLPVTMLDRVALTTFATSVAAYVVLVNRSHSLSIPLIGSIPLLVASVAYLRQRKSRRRPTTACS